MNIFYSKRRPTTGRIIPGAIYWFTFYHYCLFLATALLLKLLLRRSLGAQISTNVKIDEVRAPNRGARIWVRDAVFRVTEPRAPQAA